MKDKLIGLVILLVLCVGAVIFSIPGLIASYKQFKSGYSLEQVKLTKRPFRTFS